MYFKQIEMHGFKSFADKTIVKLEPGITAIVGPNGCGKSNILDAMRWSLGEQSAKALRGSHMQDVIFNGSEQRPPTGMAEVTLTFDNADSSLPIDFAEVTITRRVYRSGESEYMLNKAPCRLRDIQELFMDTGIGTSAYSLIGQGKIDMVLSSKPDDRRYLFEEAAGIIKYKSRKRVAMRKLDSADQNLIRLADIIAEVERQMRSLKRQVNAAIRHRELSTTLRELEIRNAWLQHNQLSGAIEDLKSQFTTSQDTYEKSSTKLTALEAKQEELNLRRVELERTLMARREGEYELESEMEKIEREIALLQRDTDFAKQQQEQADKEHKELLEKAGSMQSARSDSDDNMSGLRAEVETAQNAVAAKQEEYNTGKEAVTTADQAVEAARKAVMDSIADRNTAMAELERLGANLGSLDTQLEEIYKEQESQTARQEALTQQLQDAEKQHTGHETALDDTNQKRETAQGKREETNTKLAKINREYQELREQKSSKDARLSSLRELRDSYEGFAAGVRAIMKLKQQEMPEAEGIVGPVGDLLSTDKSYARAIEAALGGNINNVVCEQADAAKNAIVFLKKNRAGRVTFLPLDTLRPSSRDDIEALKGQPGVIGPAISHVQCDAQVMPAFEYLLYNTVIVETIDDAIRIARAERRFPKLVTLDGEVVAPSGSVTGGRTRHESQGLLGRSAEIDQLEQQVGEATSRIRLMADEVTALAESAQALSEELRALELLQITQRKDANESGVNLARTTTELNNLQQSAAQLGERRDALAARRQELDSQHGSARDRASTMEGDDEQLQAGITQSQEAAAQARQALSALGDELADLRVHLASLTQNLEESERNRLREERERAETLQEAERRVKLSEDLKRHQGELSERIKNHVERSKALSETKEEAHDKVLEAQTEQEAVLKQAEALNKELRELRDLNNTAQKEVHKLELELTQKEDRLEYLQQHIVSEYNLALGSLSEEEVGTDEYDEAEREKLVQENRKALQRLGTVNLMAIEEYEALEKRHAFLREQESDLQQARDKLLQVIGRIDSTTIEMFMETFKKVSENFKAYFRRLFNGGQARIYLLDEDDPLESGIEIEARPPGKKPQTISLLSGGEQAMTAIALLFSIFSAKPSPFCVLDEVDAPLDDANIGRFLHLVDEFVEDSQFIVITHSKQTMAHAGALFGVTQQERGVSQMVSVKLEEAAEHAS